MVNYMYEPNLAKQFGLDKGLGVRYVVVIPTEGYKIRKYRGGRMGTVTLSGFLMNFDISHDKTLSYSVEWDEKENMLIVDLKKPLKEKHK